MSWGIVGEFNDWGQFGSPDIPMVEISPNVFSGNMPFFGECKFRYNNQWIDNYGTNSFSVETPLSLISYGPNIQVPALNEGEYYIFTINLNTLLFEAIVTTEVTNIADQEELINYLESDVVYGKIQNAISLDNNISNLIASSQKQLMTDVNGYIYKSE
jgi:hypothetical protein